MVEVVRVWGISLQGLTTINPCFAFGQEWKTTEMLLQVSLFIHLTTQTVLPWLQGRMPVSTGYADACISASFASVSFDWVSMTLT